MPKIDVSIPHMGCMPYGHGISLTLASRDSFQSLIWVACPTGYTLHAGWRNVVDVSIPHMGCMPYGRRDNPPRGHFGGFQSLIWVACPTGGEPPLLSIPRTRGFNPSYGLHALRAGERASWDVWAEEVSIPHMGCMPYGRAAYMP